MSDDSLVFVIDDDESMRKALTRLLTAAAYRVESFASAREFSSRPAHDGAACMVLDLKMPETTGLELQKQLRAEGRLLPIVFVSGHGDIPASVQAMRQGAIDFLSKPFDEQQLLAAVNEALAKDRAALAHRIELRHLVERWRRLTPREREVFEHVVRGLLNKQVAGRLGTAEKTIKAHRAKVMQKMEAGSLAELVRMADALHEALGSEST